MATIQFKMNNLTINVSGVAGYMDQCTYTNLDPVDYVYKARDLNTGASMIYRFKAGTTTATNLEGFRRTKTDSTALSFLGATPPT